MRTELKSFSSALSIVLCKLVLLEDYDGRKLRVLLISTHIGLCCTSLSIMLLGMIVAGCS